MAEFTNYKVLLHLKDGSKTQGAITHVDAQKIVLGDKSYNNTAVKDVKIVQLPGAKLKKRRDERSGTPKSKEPSWESSGDVEQIKVSLDFDFEANLAMFDKKQVFAEFLKSDTVDLHDRLVSQNKVESAKPKKGDQEKIQNDEMVMADTSDGWNDIGVALIPVSKRSATPTNPVPAGPKSYKFVGDAGAWNVPLATPVQLLEVERLAKNFGAGGDDVCATNLFHMIVGKILGSAVRLGKLSHNLPPLVLLLVGDSRSGRRAMALGRHLANHGARVLAYVIEGFELEEDLKQQCEWLQKSGGKLVHGKFLVLLDILTNQLETPVELIVDALQGFEAHLPDLFFGASMESLRQLATWANGQKQRAKILSLDIPSGIDGGLGTVLDPALQFHSRHIVSTGLPVSGLAHAYKNGHIGAGYDEVLHFVVDTGVPNAVYAAKAHLRKFDKFWHRAELWIELSVAED